MPFIAPIAIPRNAKAMKLGLIMYYAGTIVFLLFDLIFDVNIRVAFLDDNLIARMAYYAVCAICFALLLWRPSLGPYISAFESLISLLALVISMSLRVLIPSEAMLDAGRGFVSLEEIANFLLVGTVSYFVWMKGLRRLADSNSR